MIWKSLLGGNEMINIPIALPYFILRNHLKSFNKTRNSFVVKTREEIINRVLEKFLKIK
jgi:hypothetical protein